MPPLSPRFVGRRWTLVGLVLAMFLSAIEATVVATALPTIVHDLGGDARYGWVNIAYLLASTVAIPLYGKLADRHGRAPLLYVGLLLFALGSLVSGFAPTFDLLVLGRVIQGAGAGAIQPVTMTIVGDLWEVHERGKVQGIIGAVWGTSGAIGPLLGSLLATTIGWRWIFWINIPFALAAIGIVALAYREPARVRSTVPLDRLGVLCTAVGAFALLLAIEQVATLPMAILSAAAFGALIFVEGRAADPVIPVQILRSPRLGTGIALLGLVGAMMMVVLTWLPLRLIAGGGSIAASAALSPLLLGWPIAASRSPALMIKNGRQATIRLGALLLAIGAIALAGFVSSSAPIWVLAVIMFVMGLGFGLLSTTTVVDAQSTVAHGQRGVVTALGAFSRFLGGAIGVAALGALRGLPGPVAGHGMTWVFVGLAGVGLVTMVVAMGYAHDMHVEVSAAHA
ncbi:MAG: MFS transporter [Gemmatimonadetes bacterium]|nr:MFS transporter [Gemmatimonadota bacterium]